MFNDGLFTKSDLENILHIGHSLKKEDITATGQFGYGFRSVFHLTDTPVLVTNEKYAVMDPLEYTGIGKGWSLPFSVCLVHICKLFSQGF